MYKHGSASVGVMVMSLRNLSSPSRKMGPYGVKLYIFPFRMPILRLG